jgi:hypothetical protein
MDIIWSCLVTIFACSWTVTHPNIPERKSFASGASSKILWCVVAVVAPEVMAYIALYEHLEVRHHLRVIKKMKQGQCTMSQLFFVYMGGVELEFEDSTETLGCAANGRFHQDGSLLNLQRAFQLNMIDMRSISVDDVNKRAKTNYIVKALVCLQASWLVAQVIGRAIANLAITTLEIVTVGYVVCALITYTSWWHKPQDAEVPIRINCKSLTEARFHEQIKECCDGPEKMRWCTRWKSTLLSVVCDLFGVVHCTAWNLFFSTFAESVTWRVASVLTVAIPPTLLWSLLKHDESEYREDANIGLLLVYVPVRLYLMIEPFVAFRSVQVGIFYTVNWSSWIPHV